MVFTEANLPLPYHNINRLLWQKQRSTGRRLFSPAD